MALATLLFFSFNAYSQGIKSLSDTLQEVVVRDAKVRIIRFGLPVLKTVITRSEIALNGESSVLTMLNGRVPGLFITERGLVGFGVSAGAAGQISMRGVGGSPTTGVLVMMDGNPQYMGIFGHPLADSYSASGVESVEVIRGPLSTYFGSNAMGGVINILTRRTNKEGFTGDAALRYGSYNTSDLDLTGSYRHQKWNLLATLNRSATDGHRANSDFSQNSGYLKIGYKLSDHIRVHTDLNLSNFKATDPGPDTLGAVRGNTLDIQRGSWSYSLDHEFNRIWGSMRVYRNFGKHVLSDGFVSEDFNNGLIMNETTHLFKQNITTFGVTGNHYGGTAIQTRSNAVLVDSSIVELGAFVLMQQNLFDRMTVNAGLRLQYHSQFGREWIPTAGFTWDLRKGRTWNINLGKGYRSPTLRELFMFNHNPALSPERIWSYETSFQKEFKSMNARLEITAFYITGDNLIVTGNMGKLYNGGSIDNKGLELAISCNPLKDLQLQLTFSHIDMKTPVYATPRNHLFLNGMYRVGKFNFLSNLRHVEHLKTTIGLPTPKGFQTYTLVNAGIQYHLKPAMTLSLNANNLLNESYETIRYYTMPGISASAGLSYRF